MTDSSAFVEKTFLRREREFSVFPYFNGRNFSGYRYEQKERKKELSWRQNILPDILRCRLQEKIAAYLRLIVSQRKERNTQRYCSFYWKNYAFFRHHVCFSLVKEGYFLKRLLCFHCSNWRHFTRSSNITQNHSSGWIKILGAIV